MPELMFARGGTPVYVAKGGGPVGVAEVVTDVDTAAWVVGAVGARELTGVGDATGVLEDEVV
jgi:hypothetical protein